MQQSSSSGSQEQHLRAQLELLQSHNGGDAAASNVRDPRGVVAHHTSSQPSNGYEDLAAVSHEAVRALGKTQVEAHIHPDLREAEAESTNMMDISPGPGQSPSMSPIDSQNTSIAPAPSSSAPDVGPGSEGRKAKRELSQSKRAAQNRAAQRAFRQRKEGYIKKLEQQVREYTDMDRTLKEVQTENYLLRDYVLKLQARLLDVQNDFPPPPANVSLSLSQAPQPSAAIPAQPQQSLPAVAAEAVTSLEAVAQAVAAAEQMAQSQEQAQTYPSPSYRTDSHEEDSRTVEEINRQFQEQQSRDNVGPGET